MNNFTGDRKSYRLSARQHYKRITTVNTHKESKLTKLLRAISHADSVSQQNPNKAHGLLPALRDDQYMQTTSQHTTKITQRHSIPNITTYFSSHHISNQPNSPPLHQQDRLLKLPNPLSTSSDPNLPPRNPSAAGGPTCAPLRCNPPIQYLPRFQQHCLILYEAVDMCARASTSDVDWGCQFCRLARIQCHGLKDCGGTRCSCFWGLGMQRPYELEAFDMGDRLGLRNMILWNTDSYIIQLPKLMTHKMLISQFHALTP